jgi:hypothetical protein
MAADKSHRPDMRTSAELVRLLARQHSDDPAAEDSAQRFPTENVARLNDPADCRRRRALRQAGL